MSGFLNELGKINQTVRGVGITIGNAHRTYNEANALGNKVNNTGTIHRNMNNTYKANEINSETRIYQAGTRNVNAQAQYENTVNRYNNMNGAAPSTAGGGTPPVGSRADYSQYARGGSQWKGEPGQGGPNASDYVGANVASNQAAVTMPELEKHEERKMKRLDAARDEMFELAGQREQANARLGELKSDNIADSEQKKEIREQEKIIRKADNRIESLEKKEARLDRKLGEKDEQIDAFRGQQQTQLQTQQTRDLLTVDYVTAMVEANKAAANSPERAEALGRARRAVEELRGPDGQVHFSEGVAVKIDGVNQPLQFTKASSHYASAEAAMKHTTRELAVNGRIGTQVSDAEIAQILQANLNQQVGQAASQAQPGAGAAVAGENGAAPKVETITKEEIVRRNVFDLANIPAADGSQAKIYNANIVKASEMPQISNNQVAAVQAMLGVDVDGKWGKHTQAAFLKACEAANIDPTSKLKFTEKDNLAVAEVLKRGAGYSAVAAGAPSNSTESVADKKEAEAIKNETAATSKAADASNEALVTEETKQEVEKLRTALAEQKQALSAIASLPQTPQVTDANHKIAASAERHNFLMEASKDLEFNSSNIFGKDVAVKNLEKKLEKEGVDGITRDGVLTAGEIAALKNHKAGANIQSLDALIAKENISLEAVSGGQAVAEAGGPPYGGQKATEQGRGA